MPSALTYPGVYVEEVASGVRTIIGVPTSIAAFVGRARRGSTDEPTTINGFGDFERTYGGLWDASRLGFAVRDFFLNGGGQAIVARIYNAKGTAATPEDLKLKLRPRKAADQVLKAIGAVAAPADKRTAAAAVPAGASPAETAAIDAVKAAVVAAADPDIDTAAATAAEAYDVLLSRRELTVGVFKLAARSEGVWGAELRAVIDTNVPKGIAERIGVADKDDAKVFNLAVVDTAPGGRSESFKSVTFVDSQRRVDLVLEGQSNLVRAVNWQGLTPPGALDATEQQAAIDAVVAADLGGAAKAVWQAQQALTAAEADPQPQQATIDAAKTDLAAKQELLKQATASLDLLVGVNAPRMDPLSAEETAVAALQGALRNARGAGDAAAAKLEEAVSAALARAEGARRAARDGLSDGAGLDQGSFFPVNGQAQKRGLHLLERTDIFNLLVIPPYTADDKDVDPDVVSGAAQYCRERRAVLIIDPPEAWETKDQARTGFTNQSPDQVGTRSSNAAMYFPRIKQRNPLRDNRLETVTPSGVIAGVIARTDTERGVWKAPAGLDAALVGVQQLAVDLTDDENGELNPHGLNCLRVKGPAGRVVWGARTMQGDDGLASEYKYLPVRRTALYIEESLYRGTQWVVFEPNDEPLWASIRLNVSAFMNGLFRKGAFQGTTPRDAYFVRCDKDTNPQEDIDRGIVNIHVGFAPLKPAEFVVISLQQIAGQLAV